VEPVRELAARWRTAERVVALTGAGISTSSGIPDFRSAGGRWERYQPVPIQDFVASEAKRAEYWRYKGETWKLMREAQPNAAHFALRDLAAAGRLSLLVTQNVDGLHERSGFPPDRLVAIHGTDAFVQCLKCGGPWKPATISFGQGLVETDLRRSLEAASSCDLFVAIGTSLVVGPINGMLPVAVGAGAAAAILTASETPFDRSARWRIADPLDRCLPEIARRVLG